MAPEQDKGEEVTVKVRPWDGIKPFFAAHYYILERFPECGHIPYAQERDPRNCARLLWNLDQVLSFKPELRSLGSPL